MTSKGLRDLFFLMVGTAILYHEFWQQEDPSPLGVFVALFLFGLIPAFRADEAATVSPLRMLLNLLEAMNGKAPPGPPANAEQAAKEAPADREAPAALDPAGGKAEPAGREGRAERPNSSAPPTTSRPASDEPDSP